MPRSATALACLAAAVLAFPAAARADLIVNGSFEYGTNPPQPGTFRTLPVGNTDMTGWTVVQSNIDWGTQGFASDGIRALDLNGDEGPGGVEQDIATTAGTTYTILFDMNANNSTPDAVSLTASAAGVSESFTYDPALMPTRPWVTETFAFTATDSVTQLSFISTTANQYFGPGLDNVRQAIPEPSTLALLGVAALAVARRPRTFNAPPHAPTPGSGA